MKIIKPPTPLPANLQPRSVFLAGSIEMGVAENWQTTAEQLLVNTPGWLLNPRRDDWDSSWVQSKSNPQFNAQVSWELEAMERADRILVYFDPNTKSPITLMELGLYANSGKMVVCCPEGFWRKGNVDMVCDRYNVPTASDLKHLIEWAGNNTTVQFFDNGEDYKSRECVDNLKTAGHTVFSLPTSGPPALWINGYEVVGRTAIKNAVNNLLKCRVGVTHDPDDDSKTKKLCEGCGYWYTGPGEKLCIQCSSDYFD